MKPRNAPATKNANPTRPKVARVRAKVPSKRATAPNASSFLSEFVSAKYMVPAAGALGAGLIAAAGVLFRDRFAPLVRAIIREADASAIAEQLGLIKPRRSRTTRNVGLLAAGLALGTGIVTLLRPQIQRMLKDAADKREGAPKPTAPAVPPARAPATAATAASVRADVP